MRIVFSTRYDLPLGDHPWHTSKYARTLAMLRAEGAVDDADILEAPMADDEDILRVHSLEYWGKLYDLNFTEEQVERAEIPVTANTVDLFWRMAGGTILAGEQALQDGIGVHLGGGFHHAFPAWAAGFCLLNDIAIGLRSLLDRNRIRTAVVVDCDLHQGDATARIFRDDPRVFTLSLHQRDAFPHFKQQSCCDVELPPGTGDDAYLAALDGALDGLFANGRRFELLHYQAGVDTYAGDTLGGLKLTAAGLRERDRKVFAAAAAADVPVVVTLGGGYTVGPDEVARLHANTALEAIRNARIRAGGTS